MSHAIARAVTIFFLILCGGCAPKSPPPLLSFDDAFYKASSDLTQTVRGLLMQRDFTALEKMATELRDTQAVFDQGAWKLRVFCFGFAPYHERPSSEWQHIFTLIKEWQQEFPDSIVPILAEVCTHLEYSSKLKDRRTRELPPSEAERAHKHERELALEALEKVKSKRSQSPIWWALRAQLVAPSEGGLEEFHQLIAEQAIYYPTYWGQYAALAKFVYHMDATSHWVAEVERAVKSRGKEGDLLYARAVMYMADEYNNIFEQSYVSYERTERGLIALSVLYPRALQFISARCKFAYMTGKKRLARELFLLIGNRVDRDCWTREEFAEAKTWASSGWAADVYWMHRDFLSSEHLRQ